MGLKHLTDEMDRFVRSKGWFDENSKRPQTPRNLSISLALETAEILAHFQWRDEIKKRLARVWEPLVDMRSRIEPYPDRAGLYIAGRGNGFKFMRRLYTIFAF